jgi:hypothetical protein
LFPPRNLGTLFFTSPTVPQLTCRTGKYVMLVGAC